MSLLPEVFSHYAIIIRHEKKKFNICAIHPKNWEGNLRIVEFSNAGGLYIMKSQQNFRRSVHIFLKG